MLLREEMANSNRDALHLEIPCKSLDWQLSAVSQVLNSFLSFFPTLDRLELKISLYPGDWQGEMEVIQWREFLHPFNSVKEITLRSVDSVRLVALALQELTGERETELLPALQGVFLETPNWQPSGPVKEAIDQFITTRQLNDQPVTVHY
jgi:hypothetical protein